jgi:hypothetical protein
MEANGEGDRHFVGEMAKNRIRQTLLSWWNLELVADGWVRW